MVQNASTGLTVLRAAAYILKVKKHWVSENQSFCSWATCVFFPKAFAEGGIADVFEDGDEEEGEEKDEGWKGEDAGEGVDDAGWENESDDGRRRQVSCEFGPWDITKLGIVLEEHVRLVGCQYPRRVLNCKI